MIYQRMAYPRARKVASQATNSIRCPRADGLNIYWMTQDCTCRIKTGHSNLVSCFGPRMRALAKVFYRGKSRGKIPYQRPNPRAKTWHKIWMTGLNPNYDTIPIPSLQNSQNKCQKSSFTNDRRRHLILPLPPVHGLPTLNARTYCWGAPIDDVTISYFRSLGQFESSVNAGCQRISMWIIRTPFMHID